MGEIFPTVLNSISSSTRTFKGCFKESVIGDSFTGLSKSISSIKEDVLGREGGVGCTGEREELSGELESVP